MSPHSADGEAPEVNRRERSRVIRLTRNLNNFATYVTLKCAAMIKIRKFNVVFFFNEVVCNAIYIMRLYPQIKKNNYLSVFPSVSHQVVSHELR